MAKRFTATEKWKDGWFSSLTMEQKLFWLYLLDECDNAGIWEKNFKVASFFLGRDVTEDWAMAFIGDKVQPVNGNKWFIPKFIEFQYNELSAQCKPHIPVIRTLEKYGIDPQTLKTKGYPKGIHTLKEQEQEQDKEKDKEKEQEPLISHPTHESTFVPAPQLAEARFDPRIKEIQDKWNAFAKKHGLPEANTMHPARLTNIVLRLREPYFDFDKILTGLEKRGWGLGKNGYKIEFDKIIGDGSYYIGLIEANTLQTETETKAQVLYDNCQWCGMKIKRTQTTSHYYVCTKNPNLKPLAASG